MLAGLVLGLAFAATTDPLPRAAQTTVERRYARLVGDGPVWRSLLRAVVEIARFTSASILLGGESGTGKELIARLVHTLDPRPDKGELVIVDCTTIVETLAGSELFGHERGAYTGAVGARDGPSSGFGAFGSDSVFLVFASSAMACFAAGLILLQYSRARLAACAVAQAPPPSPARSRSAVRSTPFVLRDGGTWRMWYLSCTEWTVVDGKPEARYLICYAESNDGFAWRRPGTIAIEYQRPDEAIARPWVLKNSTGYEMWYCCRSNRPSI